MFCYQIVNPKGEMKGSAITGPVGKEAAELWPVRTPSQNVSMQEKQLTKYPAYCKQLGGSDVRLGFIRFGHGFYQRIICIFHLSA